MLVNRHIDVGLLELQVLWLLGKRPTHGYALMRELSELKNARITQGTLYPLLSKLARKGWISPQPTAGARRKKLYVLTPEGSRVMQQACREFIQVYSGIVFDSCCLSCKGVKHAVVKPYKPAERRDVAPAQTIALMK